MSEELINREQLAAVVGKLNQSLKNHEIIDKNIQKLPEEFDKRMGNLPKKLFLWSFLGGCAAGGLLIIIEIIFKLIH